MKKWNMFYLFLVTLFIAVGCDNDTSNNDSEVELENVTESKVLKVSAMSPEDHPHTHTLKEFIETVESETNESLKLDLFPANQLGDYTSVYEEVMKGTIDIALLSVPSQLDSRVEVLNMPYLIENYEHAKKVYAEESYVYQLVDEVMEEQGIKLLGLLPLGFGGIGTAKKIENHDIPGEDKGLMVRVPQMNVYRNYAEKMGFRTVSIPFADVYTALQTGTAEGVIGAPAADNYTSFRDAIKYYYQYNNTFEATALIINQDLWDSLTEEERNVVGKAGRDFTINGIDQAEVNDNEYLNKLMEEGIEVYEFTDEEIKEFAEFVRETVWPLTEDALGEETLNQLLEEVQ